MIKITICSFVKEVRQPGTRSHSARQERQKDSQRERGERQRKEGNSNTKRRKIALKNINRLSYENKSKERAFPYFGQYDQCQTQAIWILVWQLLTRINFFPSAAHIEDEAERGTLWLVCFKSDHGFSEAVKWGFDEKASPLHPIERRNWNLSLMQQIWSIWCPSSKSA